MKNIVIIITAVLLFVGCNSSKENNTGEVKGKVKNDQLNISILLDLSDRITTQGAQANDIENIKTITEYFKANMERLGAYNAKGKIRVFFSPKPGNTNINLIANNLIIDCSKMNNKGRKMVYDTLTQLYTQSLESIYQETKSSSDWYGADIWRFFKDDVKDFCIEKDSNYRNILIIFTDGYLYHKQSYFNKGNRYTYLLGSANLNRYRNQNWKQLIEKDDFGIMTEREDMNDIEVLVLEIKAENPSNKIDEDILKYAWRKWFQEMKVPHYEVYPSDLPANTKTRIENFLSSI